MTIKKMVAQVTGGALQNAPLSFDQLRDLHKIVKIEPVKTTATKPEVQI